MDINESDEMDEDDDDDEVAAKIALKAKETQKKL